MPNPEFLAELAAFERLISGGFLAENVKEIVGQVLEAICDGNIQVLDTGKSTASWVVSLNVPIYYSADDVTRQATLTDVEAKARSLATLSNLDNFSPGDEIYISNGTAYIQLLEFAGRSAKAPNGFVRLSLEEFPDILYEFVNTGFNT